MEENSEKIITGTGSDERQVQQVLAKYVRAADQLNGDAMKALFTKAGKVEVYYLNAGVEEPLFVLSNPDEIANAISNLMAPHPARGWSHHTTHDHIISVNGDTATLDAQFIRFDTLGDARPENGWPEGTVGLKGTVTATEAGYYRPTLEKVEGIWKIATHRILHDLPFIFPGQ
ncbi:nuclear transport factor 2 family protein [Pedobacter lithocola]|uniref:Nuclear transport factor 2 family protein n=1 Tax=Pedobacter lithocola TaxID=1908239 RepID=A0ABV8PD57_9SPHI